MRSFTMEKTMPINMIFCDTDNLELEIRGFDLSFTLITEASSLNEDDLIQARKDQNVAFSKIITLISSVIDQSIAYESDRADLVYTTLSEFNNNLITLPQMSEMSLIAALHAKFNSICGPDTHVDRIRLNDTRDNLMYEYILLDEEEYMELPSTEEWNTDMPYWEGCWWNRPDTNTMDRNATTIDEFNKWNELKQESDVDGQFLSIFKEIESKFDEMFSGVVKEGELITVDFENKEVWTPKLID